MSFSESRNSHQTRSYEREKSVVFLKTKEEFGGLSNMAGGFPLRVNGIRILTSEALYQACRFPHLPDVQRLIIEQSSPMTAKMKSKPHRKNSRADWEQVRVKIMRWCLRVKLAQNWRKFSELLLETGDRPIVEQSSKDDFWGAKPVDDGTLVGMNVLGRLLMELREEVKAESRESLFVVHPLTIPDFQFFGKPIEEINTSDAKIALEQRKDDVRGFHKDVDYSAKVQQSLFEELKIKESAPPANLSVREKVVRIADLKKYGEYKETGLPWIGEVPVNWETRRAKFLLRELDQRSETGREQLLRVSQYTGVTQRESAEGSDAPDTRASSLVGYKQVQPNDLVVNIMLAWNGSMGVSRYAGIASPAYCVYRFNEGALPWYFHEVLRSPDFKNRIKAASTGVVESRLRLYSDELGRIELPLPPPIEQAAIVRYLDWANGRLVRAIRVKRKMIALLNEQKQAIIHRTVTHGLDHSLPLKPSGIPWLGDIPQHWEVLALKRVLRRLIDCEHKTAPHVDESAYRVVRTTGVRHGVLRMHGTYCTSSDAFRAWTRRGLPEPGDVIFTREAPAGEACIVPDGINVCLGQRTVLMKLNKQRLHPQFLVHMIYAGPPRISITLASQGSTVGHFNMSDIGSLMILLPPKQEQDAIVAEIKEQTAQPDIAISRLEREIELLREYRTRFVADVVTGKFDVREAAARLPEEAPLDTIGDEVDLSDETEAADEEAEV